MQKQQHNNIIDIQYKNINLQADLAKFDYQNIHIPWGQQQQYQIIFKISRGKYSQVFKAIHIPTQKQVVIKILNPIRKSKIKRQYHISNSLTHPNIIKLLKPLRCSQAKTACFVFQYQPFQDLRTLCQKFNYSDIKFYMKQLLTTLDYIHSKGIIHRDIKSHNILIDHPNKKLKIIDFGLSQFYFPQRDYSTRVSSLYYKAPELLLGNTKYNYKIDIWSAGLILAGLIFQKIPFISGTNPMDQIYKISKILGTDEIIDYIHQNNKIFRQAKQFRGQILMALKENELNYVQKSDLSEYINKQNKMNVRKEGLDLIQRMLRLDDERISARNALEHDFFKSVQE